MRLSRALASFVMLGVVLFGVRALAQAPAAPAAAPAAAAATKVDPCPIPYVVGEAVKGGELEARFGAGAFKKLAAAGDIQARGGLEVVRTAYAGMTSQAMEAVLAAYACRIKAYVAKTQPADAAAKSAAVDKALSDLSFELGMIQSAASDGAAALGVVKDGYMDKDERRPGAPVLDAAVTMAALADVDPNKLFISQSNLTLWAGLNIGSAVGVEGCGGVVHAAISDGGSSLQVSLSKAKSILINYLDPNTPPNVALGALFLSGAALPIKKSTGDTVSFKDCTKNVAAKVTTTATAVASSAPNTPPVADPVKTAEQAKNN